MYIFFKRTIIFLFVNFLSSLIYANKIDERIESLLNKMTIEEKVAQLRITNAPVTLDANNKPVLSKRAIEAIKNGIAGFKNPGTVYSPEKSILLTTQLQDYIKKNTRLGIPAFFITESYNGVDAKGCTRFPRPITLSSSWNVDLVKNVYDCIGKEARVRGFHLTHSPEADVVRDSRFGRMSETFGEDTYLVTTMIINAINGLQGNSIDLQNNHIGAVVKHFAGYGLVAGGRNFASVEVSPRSFIDEILPPFEAAVKEAHTLGVMASHSDLNGIPCHSNKELLTDLLRKKWGFDGYVVSDANDIERLNIFMSTAATPEDAAVKALKAGVNVDLYSDNAYALIPQIVKKHPELMEYIDNSVRYVLNTKLKLGLFNENNHKIKEKAFKTRGNESISLAKDADEESIILLKNINNLLPLNLNNKKIALVGPNVYMDTQASFEKIDHSKNMFFCEKGFYLTTTQKEFDSNKFTSIINRKVTLTPKDECLLGIDKIIDVAKRSDIIVLFVGGDSFTSREATFNSDLGDRCDLNLVGEQDELVDRICSLGKPVIAVVKHRRTLSFGNLAEKVDAIVDCWELSEFGEEAIAKVIFGKVNPSGKLPVTVPRTIGQVPFYYSQKAINFKKGYLFTDNTPLYPFGYGLSYSDFVFSNMKLSKDVLHKNDSIVVSVDIKNNSKLAGKEVAQLYIKQLCGEVTRPMKELKAFKKIFLNPDQTKKVEFRILPSMMEYTGIDMTKRIDEGDFIVSVGKDSEDFQSLKFSFKY